MGRSSPRLSQQELKAFLNEKVVAYNHPRFIESDPIQVPHRFQQKEDIEIAAFLTATIAWGNRKSIITSASRMMELMGHTPYDFVMRHQPHHLEKLQQFVHRTFNGEDLTQFIRSLRHVYDKYDGLEGVFAQYAERASLQPAITTFKELFFSIPHPKRSTKHISDPSKGSAAKRINMFLRWMVRRDGCGVDFGLWRTLSPSQLSCPLDVHSGKVARALNLLTRKQNDAKAVRELDQNLRALDPMDPVKYDFALFGLGVFEGF